MSEHSSTQVQPLYSSTTARHTMRDLANSSVTYPAICAFLRLLCVRTLNDSPNCNAAQHIRAFFAAIATAARPNPLRSLSFSAHRLTESECFASFMRSDLAPMTSNVRRYAAVRALSAIAGRWSLRRTHVQFSRCATASGTSVKASLASNVRI